MTTETVCVPRELLLELRDTAYAEAQQYHIAMKNYRHHEHDRLDKIVADVDALLAQPVAGAGVQVQICKLGIYGKAYDAPSTRRAYTYADQPDNVGAWRLAEAAIEASKNKGGDHIDYGLGLLKSLQQHGFGVFEIAAALQPAEGSTDE